jgi:hypothetical protein
MVLRVGLPPLFFTLIVSGRSFLLGFALSRYVIDRELRRADAAVLQSAYDLDDLETVMAQQFRTDYQLLEVKVKELQTRKEQH